MSVRVVRRVLAVSVGSIVAALAIAAVWLNADFRRTQARWNAARDSGGGAW